MTEKIITIKASDSLINASKILSSHGFRHLLVTDDRNKIVGILSDRDIDKAMMVKKLNSFRQEMSLDPNILVEDFMSWPVMTVNVDTPIRKVAEQMLEQKISALLVEDTYGQPKGIITTDDLLKIFLKDEVHGTYNGLEALSHYFTDPELRNP